MPSSTAEERMTGHGPGRKMLMTAVFLAALIGLVLVCTSASDMSASESTYTVHFDGNGGTGEMDDQPRTVDDRVALSLCTFERTGYDFSGWLFEEGMTSKIFEDGTTENIVNSTRAEPVVLKAQWTAKKFRVTIDSNTGSGGCTTYAYYGQTLKLDVRIVKAGHYVEGYYTDILGDVKAISFKGVLLPSVDGYSDSKGRWIHLGDATFYARWEPKTYVIEIPSEKGDGERRYSSVRYYETELAPFEPFVREGYTNDGYWNSTDKVADINLRLLENVTSSGVAYTDRSGQWIYDESDKVVLYPVWIPNTYTIRFAPNGGVGSLEDIVDAEYDKEVTLTKNVPISGIVRSGYSFAGWNTESDGSGTHFDDEAKVRNLSSDDGAVVTLYAEWEALTFSITLNSNGGDDDGGATATYMEDYLIEVTGSVKVGYHVIGYFDDAVRGKMVIDSNEKLCISVEGFTDGEGRWIGLGDAVLYAHWEANTYKIHYDSNGGTGTMSDQNMTYDVEDTLNSNRFSKDSTNMVGWNTVRDARSVQFFDRESVINLSSRDGDTVTLYAVWSSLPLVTATFAGGEGEGPDAIKALKGDEITLPANTFTKDGYRFDRWTDGSADYAEGAKYVLERDTVFTAKWIGEDIHDVIYTIDGKEIGGDYMRRSYTCGTEVEIMPQYTIAGYDVTVWKTTDVTEWTVEDIRFIMPNNDVTFDAQTSACTYDITLCKNGGDADGSAKALFGGDVSDYVGVVREGYDLNGYYTDPIGGTKVLNDCGEAVKGVSGYTDITGKWIMAGDCELYAQWVPIKYLLHIEYRFTDGEKAANDYDGMYASGEWYEIYSPELTGFSPDQTKVCGNMIVDGYNTIVVYTQKEYTLSYDTRGGSSIPSKTVRYGDKITEPAPPTRANSVFIMWQDNGSKFVFDERTLMPARDLTLTAVWSVKPTEASKDTVQFSDPEADTMVINKNDPDTNHALDDAEKTEVRMIGDVWSMDIPKVLIKSADGSVTVSAREITDDERSSLPSDIIAKITGKDVFSLGMINSKDVNIDFSGNTVTVTLPYTLKDGESPQNVKVHCISGNKITDYEVSYDRENRRATFTAEHFSLWYVDSEAPAPAPENNDSTVMIVIIAVVAVIAIGAFAFMFLRKRD